MDENNSIPQMKVTSLDEWGLFPEDASNEIPMAAASDPKRVNRENEGEQKRTMQEQKDEQEEEIHVPSSTTDVLDAVGLGDIENQDSKPSAVGEEGSLAYESSQPQDGDVDIALPGDAEHSSFGWCEVPDHGDDGGQGDDGLVYTGYKGGLLVKTNFSAALGSLENEERAQDTQQEESRLFSAWAGPTEQNQSFSEWGRGAGESDGLFFTGRNHQTYLGEAERSLAARLQRTPMQRQSLRENGVSSALRNQAFRANMRAAAASLAEDFKVPSVEKDWSREMPGCQQKMRRSSAQSEPSMLVKPWHQPAPAVASPPEEDLPQSEPTTLVTSVPTTFVNPLHQRAPAVAKAPEEGLEPDTLVTLPHQLQPRQYRGLGPTKKPRRKAPSQQLDNQKEPPTLVKPWHQPRQYRRPDPATWEDIKANAKLTKNPPPKCGQRSWEESRAAAKSVLGYFPDDEERHHQPKEIKEREVVSVIGASDVFTNRQWLKHAGNLRYREALSESIDDYKTADSESEKIKVAEQVMAIVHEKGGRFLRHEGSWRLLDDEAVMVFVLQSLRDFTTTRDSCPRAIKPGSEENTQQQSPINCCAPLVTSNHPSSDDNQSTSSLDWEETGYEKTVIARKMRKKTAIARAMRNYEAFHDSPRGAATVMGLRASSAGIEGWAAATTGGADNGTIWDVESQSAVSPLRRALARTSEAWPRVDDKDLEAARQRDLEAANDHVVTIVQDNAKSRCINRGPRNNDFSRHWVAGAASVEGYDDAVVEVALYNYECFYGLKPGTACVDYIRNTSAGIEGWAACVLSEEMQPQVNREAASANAVEKGGTRRRKGDDEEARMLQIALLESVGARPPRGDRHLPSDDDTDEDSDHNRKQPQVNREAASVNAVEKRGTRKCKGDEEEARMLQIALLESAGARPPRGDRHLPSDDDAGEDSDHDCAAHSSIKSKAQTEDLEDKKGCREKQSPASEEISSNEAAADDEKPGSVCPPHIGEVGIPHTSSDNDSECRNEGHLCVNSEDKTEAQEEQEGFGGHNKRNAVTAVESSTGLAAHPLCVGSQMNHPEESFPNNAALGPQEIEAMRDNTRLLRSLCFVERVEISALKTILEQCADDHQKIKRSLTSNDPRVDLMELLILNELSLDAIRAGVKVMDSLAATTTTQSPPGVPASVGTESAPTRVDTCAWEQTSIWVTSPSKVSRGPEDKQELMEQQPSLVQSSQPEPVAIPKTASDESSGDEDGSWSQVSGAALDESSGDGDGSWSQVSGASGSVSDGVLVVEDDGTGSCCGSIEIEHSDSNWSAVSSGVFPAAG